MKNLMITNSMLESLNENLDGEDFKDFINQLNDYFLNGVIPNFEGIKKVIFNTNKSYYDYLSFRYEKGIQEKLGLQDPLNMK